MLEEYRAQLRPLCKRDILYEHADQKYILKDGNNI